MPGTTDSQLVNALVGEAVKLLSSVGAPAEIVGAFAVGYPTKVSEILARHRPEADPVDLEKMVQDTMARALRDAGLVRERSDAGAEPSQTVNVEIQGRRTTVKVRTNLVRSLSEAAGTFKGAKKLIQDFAEAAPAGTENRSAWVDDQINSYLLLKGHTPSTSGVVSH